MDNLKELFSRISSVPDYSGIAVTDANTRGRFSTRPLHVAAVWGDCEAIRQLVVAGARIDDTGEHGFTALMEAVAQNHVDAAKLLIELGASAVRNDDGQLPSEYALSTGNHELAEYLRKNGC